MPTTSRQQILADIRRQLPVDAPLPALDGPWTRYADPLAHFLDVLNSVGGSGQRIDDEADLRAAVQRVVDDVHAQRILSTVPAATAGTVEWSSLSEPAQLADIDLAVLEGELAVAENAAVWVTDAAIPHRSAYFLTQHLVLVVPAARLVHNMHEAYAWLAGQSADGQTADGRPFATPGFGTFLSGPSKTADIEQSLVVGAHGARSLTVLLTAF